MSEFQKLLESAQKDEIIVLQEGEGGAIQVRSSHETDYDVALSWGILCPEDAEAAPQRVVVRKYDLMVPYQL